MTEGAIVITESARNLARLIASGGWFMFDDLLEGTGVGRDTITKALSDLEDLGAIRWTRPTAGRPRKGSRGSSTLVTVAVSSPIWTLLKIKPNATRS